MNNTPFTDTMAYDEFCDVVTSKRFVNDVKKLSPGHQTSNVESYHNIINKFAPKSTHFSFPGMMTR